MPDDILKLLARILLSVISFVTGFGKLIDPSGMAGLLGTWHLPAPQALTYLAAICEVAGAIAVVAGFRLGIVGILLAAWCVLTGLVVHLHMPIDLMKNLGLAGGFLLVASSGGAGALAVETGRKVQA